MHTVRIQHKCNVDIVVKYKYEQIRMIFNPEFDSLRQLVSHSTDRWTHRQTCSGALQLFLQSLLHPAAYHINSSQTAYLNIKMQISFCLALITGITKSLHCANVLTNSFWCEDITSNLSCSAGTETFIKFLLLWKHCFLSLMQQI